MRLANALGYSNIPDLGYPETEAPVIRSFNIDYDSKMVEMRVTDISGVYQCVVSSGEQIIDGFGPSFYIVLTPLDSIAPLFDYKDITFRASISKFLDPLTCISQIKVNLS
eukprot:gene14540-17178_t